MKRASFVLASVGGPYWAAVRRSRDGLLGLPGGKLEEGETAEQAARREALEEGWRVVGPLVLVTKGLVGDTDVSWFWAPDGARLVGARPGDTSSPDLATLADILRVRELQAPLAEAVETVPRWRAIFGGRRL